MGPDQDRLSSPGQRPANSEPPQRPQRPQRPPAQPAWVVNVALRREQERRLAKLNDPRWEWARGLVMRRTAVAAWLVLVVALLTMWSALLYSGGRGGVRLVLLAVAALTRGTTRRAAVLIRNQAIRGLLDLPIEQLTERQRRLRERTDKLAGRWMLALAAAGLLTIAATGGRLGEAGGLPMALVLASVALPLVVPTLVAAWIAPDDRAVHAARIPSNF